MNPDTSDPPETLNHAESLLSEFLSKNGYPPSIRWVLRNNVVPDGHLGYLIQEQAPQRAFQTASKLYQAGLQRGLGISLKAICATDSFTFATIFIPVDEADAMNHLVGRDLKLSCPTTLVPASTVRNPFQWRLIKLRNRRLIAQFRRCEL